MVEKDKTQIPKVIHYCWFGGNPLPKSALKFISTWRKFFPDYEIKEWNENNFDINIIPYVREAYDARKYAFVSDYARFWILYHYGGLYFDVDVKVIADFQEIIARGPFMGREFTYKESEKLGELGVNPGLVLASYPHHHFYKEVLDFYSGLHFVNKEGEKVPYTVVEHVSGLLQKYGLKNKEGIQEVAGINIYPADYFSPKSSLDLKLRLTKNSRSIHYFAASWKPPKRRKIWVMGKKYPRTMRMLVIIKHLLDGTRPI